MSKLIAYALVYGGQIALVYHAAGKVWNWQALVLAALCIVNATVNVMKDSTKRCPFCGHEKKQEPPNA